MKVIINCSNLVIGGALQVAISFLNEIKELGEDDYHVFLSKALASQIHTSEFSENFTFYLFEKSPARFRNRFQVVRKMKVLESQIKPDVVFTVFGPSFWIPKAPHVMGFALGWTIYHDSVAFRQLSLKEKVFKYFRHAYMLYRFKIEADIFVVEANHVKERLSKILSLNPSKVYVVSNTCNSHFLNFDSQKSKPLLSECNYDEFRLLAIGADYPHKNFTVIKKVIPFLKERGLKVKFVLTLPHYTYKKDFSDFEDWILNVGPVKVEQCPQLYSECDALFLPTLLESFTASYPEAMKMGLPILTSDLWFAHEICGDAAVYFDPLDPKSIAEQIFSLCSSPDRQKGLIKLGYQKLEAFCSAQKRAENFIDILTESLEIKN